MPPKGYKYTQLCYHTNFNFSIKIIIDTILLKTTVRCVINIKEIKKTIGCAKPLMTDMSILF